MNEGPTSTIISRSGQPIKLEEWEAVIEASSALSPAPEITTENPFTGKKTTFSGEGKAHFDVDDEGRPLGTLRLTREGAIEVSDVPRDICEAIAVQLQASVEDDLYRKRRG